MGNTNTFTDYIKFEHTATKTKWRLDAIVAKLTHRYFEQRRKSKAQKETPLRSAYPQGALILNYSKTDRIEAKEQRKADYCLSINSEHLSSIYPFGENGFSYGDIPGTNDVLIFKDNLEISTKGIIGGSLEIWIAPNQLKAKQLLLQMVDEGYLDDELELLRQEAKDEPKA